MWRKIKKRKNKTGLSTLDLVRLDCSSRHIDEEQLFFAQYEWTLRHWEGKGRKNWKEWRDAEKQRELVVWRGGIRKNKLTAAGECLMWGLQYSVFISQTTSSMEDLSLTLEHAEFFLFFLTSFSLKVTFDRHRMVKRLSVCVSVYIYIDSIGKDKQNLNKMVSCMWSARAVYLWTKASRELPSALPLYH